MAVLGQGGSLLSGVGLLLLGLSTLFGGENPTLLYGLLIIFLQRSQDLPAQNDLTGTDNPTAAAVAGALAVRGGGAGAAAGAGRAASVWGTRCARGAELTRRRRRGGGGGRPLALLASHPAPALPHGSVVLLTLPPPGRGDVGRHDRRHASNPGCSPGRSLVVGQPGLWAGRTGRVPDSHAGRTRALIFHDDCSQDRVSKVTLLLEVGRHVR